MKIIQWTDKTDADDVCGKVVRVLASGGLVCIPCNGRYRVVADLGTEDAVLRLMQSKGRVRTAPALIFIDGEASLGKVAAQVDPLALRMARALWPKPLTIRVKPQRKLPSKVLKQLGGAKSKIGVRVPADPLVREIVSRAARPLLASSANRERKTGDHSPAQVRKTFGATVDLFVDRGELQPGPVSTVIDVKKGRLVIERAGAISEDTLRELAAE